MNFILSFCIHVSTDYIKLQNRYDTYLGIFGIFLLRNTNLIGIQIWAYIYENQNKIKSWFSVILLKSLLL